ncbi:MAG: tetratricopeptide repeat protein [Bacteroidota bacterium]
MGITNNLHIESNLKKASLFVSEGNHLAAIQIYKKLLNEKDAVRTATIKLADIYDQFGKSESALKLFFDYLEGNKDDEEVIRLVSFYMFRKSMFKEALNFIDKYQHISDENIDYIRGLLYFHNKQFEIAHLFFKNFVSQYSSSEYIPSIFLYLAKTHMIYSEFDEALENVRESIESSNSNPEAYKIEAEIYYNKEMYYHAGESIRKAIKMDPTVIEWRHLQIRILLMLGELTKAESNMKESVDNSLSSAELLAMLGHSYLKNNKTDNAKNYFEEALKIHPELPDAIEGLKLC